VRAVTGKVRADAAESENLCMRGHSKRENREVLLVSVLHRGKVTTKRNGQKTSRTVQLTLCLRRPLSESSSHPQSNSIHPFTRHMKHIRFSLFVIASAAVAVPPPHAPAEQTDSGTDGALRRLVEQREQHDKTVWKAEVDAQAFERVFVSMWDELRATNHDLDIFNKVNFRKIALPTPKSQRNLEWGIVQTSYAMGKKWLDKSQLADWLEKMSAAGYQVHESEWHHSEFQPAIEDDPGRSVVSFLLHVTAADQRIILRGELRVQWTADSTVESPQIDSLTVANLNCLTREGPPVFQRHALPSTGKKLPRAQPLLVYDLTGDGKSEIILGESNVVFRNLGSGKYYPENFLRVPKGTIVNGIIADFNRNGRPDYVCVGSDYLLYRFDADQAGRFGAEGQKACDVKFDRPQVFSAGDVDSDGDLDLWVGQYKPPFIFGQMPTPYYDANDGFPDYLLINDGRGIFTDGTQLAGLTEKANRRTYSGTLVDLNDDLHLDLVVVSDFSGVDIYQNDGTGRFHDITGTALEERHTFGMGCSLADYDRNGYLDLYVIGMSSTTARRLSKLGLGREEYEQIQAMRPVMGYGNRMYMNNGTDRLTIPVFNDQVAHSGWSWGCSSFDFDNDADRDIYVANGHRSGESCQDYCTSFWRHDIYVEASDYDADIDQLFDLTLKEFATGKISWNGYEHNKLWMNRDGKEFIDVAWLLGVAFEFDSRAVVSDDIDSDGRMDLFVTEYITHGQRETYRLTAWRNTMETDNHWIGIRLQDSVDGGSAIGAKVMVQAEDTQFVQRVLTGDSFTAQHPSSVHFGLGARTELEMLTVRWADGRTTSIEHPALDRYYDLSTGAGE
jgi:hypothetical protein